MRFPKLNRLNASIAAIFSASVLTACGGGGGSGGSSYSSASASGSALTLTSTSTVTSTTTGSTSSDVNASASSATSTYFGQSTALNRVANTAFTNAQTANKKAYDYERAASSNLTLTYWPTTTIGTTKVGYNYNTLYIQGLLPVLGFKNTAGYYLPISSASTTKMNKTATLSKSEQNFNGSGVSVVMIDGTFNASHAGFKKIPTEIALPASIAYTDANSRKILGLEEDHGTKVGLIIAANRSSSYAGLTPDVNLYYTQLTNGVAVGGLGDVYKTIYNTAKPAVVSNAYIIGDANESGTGFASAQAGLVNITAKSDTPLFVFSTGNLNATEWLTVQYQADPSIASSSQWSDLNYGQSLGSNSSLAKLLDTNANVSNAIIAVTGYSYNPNNDIGATVNTTKNTIGGTTLDTNVTKSSTTSFTTNDIISGYASGASSLSRATNCGVAKWSCIAAAFNYKIAAYTTSGSKDFNGTSAAAPQVTAIAAMVKQQFDWMTAKQLKTTLLTTAYDVGEAGVDEVFGWGIVDAGMALNGPAAFVFGDFKANLSNTKKRYYFNNNITGGNGLYVYGASTYDQLVLTGSNNTYTGNTVVNSGALILQDKYSAGISSTATGNNSVSLASNISVNSKGALYAYNAKVANLTNNGYTQLSNVTVTGDLVNKENATLAVDLSKGATVKGSAKVNGTLALVNTGSYVKTNRTTQVTVLTANNLSGNFSNIYSDYSGSALVNYSLYQNSTSVVVSIKASSATSYAATTTSLTSADISVATVGAQQLDKLFAAANAYATSQVATNGEAIITSSEETPALTSSYYGNQDLSSVAVGSAKTEVSLTSAVDTGTSDTTLISLTSTDSTATSTASTNALTTADVSATSLTNVQVNANTTSFNSTTNASLSTNTTNSTVNLTSTDSSALTTSTTAVTGATASTASSTSAASGVTLTATDASVAAAAALIQSMNTAQVNALMLRTAGTLYNNVQQAVEQETRSRVLDFASTVLNRFTSDDNSFHTYVKYDYARNDWERSSTAIKGRYNGNSETAGFHTRLIGDYNLGLAVYSGWGKWAEGNDYVDRNYTAGYADVKTYGAMVSLGASYKNSFIGATLFGNYHKYEVTRTTLTDADQRANFSSTSLGLDLRAGYLLAGNGLEYGNGLILEGGITNVFKHQKGFKEHAQNDTSKYVSLDVQSRNNYKMFGQIQLRGYAAFTTFGLASRVDASLGFETKLLGSKERIKLRDGNNVGQVFKSDFLARLSLGYAINLTDALKIRLSGNYEKASDWQQKRVGLTLDYAL
ncbi:S8 family serine peptidase [Psittacicella hinzii]|nr:S8 family serine peptidase [Psittacicella hinzii]